MCSERTQPLLCARFNSADGWLCVNSFQSLLCIMRFNNAFCRFSMPLMMAILALVFVKNLESGTKSIVFRLLVPHNTILVIYAEFWTDEILHLTAIDNRVSLATVCSCVYCLQTRYLNKRSFRRHLTCQITMWPKRCKYDGVWLQQKHLIMASRNTLYNIAHDYEKQPQVNLWAVGNNVLINFLVVLPRWPTDVFLSRYKHFKQQLKNILLSKHTQVQWTTTQWEKTIVVNHVWRNLYNHKYNPSTWQLVSNHNF